MHTELNIKMDEGTIREITNKYYEIQNMHSETLKKYLEKLLEYLKILLRYFICKNLFRIIFFLDIFEYI